MSFFFETFLFALNILNQNKIEWSFTKIKIEKSLINKSIQLFVYQSLKNSTTKQTYLANFIKHCTNVENTKKNLRQY